MKVGDKVEVFISGLAVAQAEVKELADGTATLIVPATRVVMGVRSTLTDLPSTDPQGNAHVTLGTEPATTGQQTQNDTDLSNTANTQQASASSENNVSAPVVETPPVEVVESTSAEPVAPPENKSDE